MILMINPKSETLNSKQTQNFNLKISNVGFKNLSFGFV
jgi:hypothetical protein